jgi:hypothetical protein
LSIDTPKSSRFAIQFNIYIVKLKTIIKVGVI